MLDYLNRLYHGYGYYYLQTGVPQGVIWGLWFAAIGSVLLFALIDSKNLVKNMLRFWLFEYVLFILSSAVLFRDGGETTGYSLIPFWSYLAISEGQEHLLMEIVLNIILFCPVGLFCSFLFKGKSLKRTMIIGVTVSVMIELLQLLFNKGFAEIDDVIHNVLGCIAGYLIGFLLLQLCRVFRNDLQEVSC